MKQVILEFKYTLHRSWEIRIPSLTSAAMTYKIVHLRGYVSTRVHDLPKSMKSPRSSEVAHHCSLTMWVITLNNCDVKHVLIHYKQICIIRTKPVNDIPLFEIFPMHQPSVIFFSIGNWSGWMHLQVPHLQLCVISCLALGPSTSSAHQPLINYYRFMQFSSVWRGVFTCRLTQVIRKKHSSLERWSFWRIIQSSFQFHDSPTHSFPRLSRHSLKWFPVICFLFVPYFLSVNELLFCNISSLCENLRRWLPLKWYTFPKISVVESFRIAIPTNLQTRGRL